MDGTVPALGSTTGAGTERGNPMLVRESIWNEIRDQFTKAEKEELTRCIEAECICPKGLIIDPDGLNEELKTKIMRLTSQLTELS